MSETKEIWLIIEKVALPIWGFVVVVTYGSLFVYLGRIKNLRRMLKQIDRTSQLNDYEFQIFPFLFIGDMIFAFRGVKSLPKKYLDFELVNRQLTTLAIYRRYYKIAIPVSIILLIIGILIRAVIV